MDIKSLPSDVKKHLRNGTNINSVVHCVTELVLNSLDAKSTAIAVRVNLLKFRIQVVDNGKGITKSNMHRIGIRYMTSKCHSLTDLKKIKQFGFRGEALASIRGVSKKMDISSRIENVENTYSKTHENGRWSTVEVVKHRPSQGTTITVEGFMHNLPVRQKRINESLDLNETKRSLESLTIMFPNVSFSLRNDVNGKVLMQSKQTQTVSQALVNLYPDILIDDLMEIKVLKCKTSVSGLIYKRSYVNNKLQLIYLNKRPITSPKIQKLANSLLVKSCIFQKSPQILRHMLVSTPAEKTDHPVYIINIRCPYSDVDLTLSPSKKTIEFKHWDIVLKCITKAITKVLEEENLIGHISKMGQIDKKGPENNQVLQSQFGVSQIQGAVTSVPFKRKLLNNIVELPKKLLKTNLNCNVNEVIDSVVTQTSKEKPNKFQSPEKNSFGLSKKISDNLIIVDDHIQTETNKWEKLSSSSLTKCTYNANNSIAVRNNDKENKNEKIINPIKKTCLKSNTKDKTTTTKRKNVSNNNYGNFLTYDVNHKKNLRNNYRRHNVVKELIFPKINKKIDTHYNDLSLCENIDDRVNDNTELETSIRKNKKPTINNNRNDFNTKLQNQNKVSPINIFDKHANTQSLVLNSEFDSPQLDNNNPLLNSSINTNTINNQENGKDLIMDMFLKSTLIYPYKGPEITDNNTLKAVVVKTTNQNLQTECRNQNTTMTMSLKVMSKKTIITNSMYVLHNADEAGLNNNRQNNSEAHRNLKKNSLTWLHQIDKIDENPKSSEKHHRNVDEKMISKGIQTTMIEQQKELNFNFNRTDAPEVKTNSEFDLSNFIPHNGNYNVTFSKYFRESHQTKGFRNLSNRKSYRPFSEELINFDEFPEHIDFNLYSGRSPKFMGNRESSRPVVHFGCYPLNGRNIPHFGSTNYFLKPMIFASNKQYKTQNDFNFNNECLNYKVHYSNNCRRPIQRYISDYNFDFSNLKLTKEPYKPSLELQNNNFAHLRKNKRQSQYSYYNGVINNDIHNDFTFEPKDVTIPLYQRYNPRIVGFNECLQEPTNLFSGNFTNQKPQHNFNEIICTNHHNGKAQISKPDKINSEFIFNHVNEVSNFSLIEQNKELPKCNDYQHENNFQPNDEELQEPLTTKRKNIIPTFNELTAMLLQQMQDNEKSIPSSNLERPHKSNGFNKGVLRGGLEEQCYSPFFYQPPKKSKRQHKNLINGHQQSECDRRHQQQEIKSDIKSILKNDNLLKARHEHASPFFRKVLKNPTAEPLITKNKNFSPFVYQASKHRVADTGCTSKVYQNGLLSNLFSNATNNKIEARSPFFHIDKYQQQKSSNRILPQTELNDVCSKDNQHQQFFFVPEQNGDLLNEQVHKNCVSNQKCRQCEGLFKEQQRQLLIVQMRNKNDSVEEPLLSLQQYYPQNDQHLQADLFETVERNYKEQAEDHSLLSKEKAQGNPLPLAPLENVYQGTKLHLKKFEWSPFQQNFNEVNPFPHISNISQIQKQPQKFQNDKSKLTLRKIFTEPCYPNVSFNDQKLPATTNMFTFNFSPQATPCDNIMTEGNKEVEYSFTTPNINLSTTEGTIEKINLDLTENSCELHNSSVCSNNFKPPLSSTRFEIIEESSDKLNMFPPDEMLGTLQNSDVVDATPTKFHSFPILSLIPNQCKPDQNRFIDCLKNNSNKSNNVSVEKYPQEPSTIKELQTGSHVQKLRKSTLNVSISTIKKVRLIETGLANDCQLNKKSESDDSEQLDMNFTKDDNCKLEELKLSNDIPVNSNKLVDLQAGILEKEWIKKINKFGSAFYINKRTGMTSMYSPKQDANFNFTKRFEFVPKGLSPIFVETNKVDVSLSPASKKSLHEAIMKSYENELNTIKWEKYIETYQDVNKFFEELYREKTKQLEFFVPNMATNELPRSMMKLYKNEQARPFTKDIFAALEVIGQLDNKFIVTLFKARKMILLFDQHAIHERVLVEKLLDDYKEDCDNDYTIKFKSTTFQEKLTLHFLKEDLNVLEQYKNLFKDLGLSYETMQNQIAITHIPTCIYSKFIKSKNQSDDLNLKNLITSLIYEHINMITSTRGLTAKIPKVLQNVINSEACRGAIKFGDHLTHDECVQLLRWLSECKLPFQCAHGRPTLTPIVTLNQDFTLEKKKPNLRKLKLY